jgi:hypothetical protein
MASEGARVCVETRAIIIALRLVFMMITSRFAYMIIFVRPRAFSVAKNIELMKPNTMVKILMIKNITLEGISSSGNEQRRRIMAEKGRVDAISRTAAKIPMKKTVLIWLRTSSMSPRPKEREIMIPAPTHKPPHTVETEALISVTKDTVVTTFMFMFAAVKMSKN